MDIRNACSTEFATLTPEDTLSDARGLFSERESTRAIVVRGDDGFTGALTREQLLGSKHSPDERTRSVIRHPPRVSPTEDVRETARLMVESGFDLLPVFEGERFAGVVKTRDVLAMVRPHLDALDVDDVYSEDRATATSETTLGEAINGIRQHGVSHLPVVDDGDPVGMVSLSDLVDFTVRAVNREQGGSLDGFDGHGGRGSADDYRVHGGHGERAGFAARLLELPVENVMSRPPRSVAPDAGLDEAVSSMYDDDDHSLVVEDDAGGLLGVVTTTDVLRSLTWTDETHMPVQIFGTDLMDVLERPEVAHRLEAIQGKYAAMDVIEATVLFQEHDERKRGLPLVRSTVRLFTDRDIYSGTHEAYGAEAAFDEACELLERNVLEAKGREQAEQGAAVERKHSAELVEWWASP